MNQPYPTEQQAITNLQTYLRQLSYFDDTIPAPPVDGIFGDITRTSLTAFQANNGLPETGVADRLTHELLYDRYVASIEDHAPPHSILLFPRYPYGYEVTLGEESFLVMAIQHMLLEIGILYDIPDLALNGVYDEPTARAIGDFQDRNLLPRTERVDKKTHDKLVDSFHILSNDFKQ